MICRLFINLLHLCMQKSNLSYKPIKIIDGYQIKKQQRGLFKVVEFSHYSNESKLRKRTIYKDLDISNAENILYRLETKK